MAATGLMYLAILTAFGQDLVARILLDTDVLVENPYRLGKTAATRGMRVAPRPQGATMDVMQARAETNQIMDGLIAGLTPEHREMSTPCKKWTVHELIDHMVAGGHMISSALTQDPSTMPEPDADHLPEGPAAGWAGAVAAMAAAATPENLEGPRQLPFGEMPGAVGMSVITADHLTHAWDLARATGQDDQRIRRARASGRRRRGEWCSPTTSATATRSTPVQPCADDAPAIDRARRIHGSQRLLSTAPDAPGCLPPGHRACAHWTHAESDLERVDQLRAGQHPGEALQRRLSQDGALQPDRLGDRLRGSSRSASRPTTARRCPTSESSRATSCRRVTTCSITDDEVAALDPEAVRTIDIDEFVDLADIDPIFYDNAYHLVPDEQTAKPYKLLANAMEEAGKVGICHFVMRSKQYLAAVRPGRRSARAVDDGLRRRDRRPHRDRRLRPARRHRDRREGTGDGRAAHRHARRRPSTRPATRTRTARPCSS